MAKVFRTLFDSDGDNTAQVCKTSGGRVHYLEVSNRNTVDAYLQLFDVAAASVTVGTTTPKQSFLVPGGAASTLAGAMDRIFNPPMQFQIAITYACTTTPTGNTDPTTGLNVNIGYE